MVSGHGDFLWKFTLFGIWSLKYGMHENGWDTADVNRGSNSCPWAYISKTRAGFLSNIKLVIGGGQKIRFWEDVWVGERMLS